MARHANIIYFDGLCEGKRNFGHVDRVVLLVCSFVRMRGTIEGAGMMKIVREFFWEDVGK